MGDDYSDDDVPDMDGVSEHCLGNTAVMHTYKILLTLITGTLITRLLHGLKQLCNVLFTGHGIWKGSL